MVHHVHFRSRGGPTQPSNLVTLCARCHGLVHDGLLVPVGDDAARLTFVDAQQRPLDAAVVRAGEALALPRADVSAPPAAPDVRQVTTLQALPQAIDGAWWHRHAHLIRMGGKGLEFTPGEPLPEPEAETVATPTPRCAAFDAASMRAAFRGIVGQDALLARLETQANGSHARGHAFPHTLLTGPAGTGKTTIAQALAAGFGRRLVKTTGPLLQDVHELLRLLAGLRQGDVFFVEEVHAVPRAVLEALYEAMVEGGVSLTLHEGARARAVRLALPAFTLVAATTEQGDLPTPFLGRFGLSEWLGYYAKESLTELVGRQAEAQGFTLEPGAAARVAAFSRGTPREALRLLGRVLDEAASRAQVRVEVAAVSACLVRLGYDERGLTLPEQRYVSLLRKSLTPVPIARLARLLGESIRTLLRDIEPFLFRLGLVEVGPRGRSAAHRPRLLAEPALG
jgi:Holliday junction DNA helicase RuvB